MKAGNAQAMHGDIWDWLKVSGVGGFGVAVLIATLRFVAWVFPFKASREDRREDRLDRINDKILQTLTSDVASLKEEGAALKRENEDLRTGLHECERRHVESDRKLATAEGKILKLEALAQAAGSARQQAQQIIAAEKIKDREQ